MLTKIFSAATIGIDTHLVDVEVDLSFGLLQFFIVGLPDTAIKESRQRVQTALKNCSFKLPERKITVNLAPADLKKEGTVFDLPIAIGILQAAQIIQIDSDFLSQTIFLGELSLDGTIKSINGVLPIAYDAIKLNKKRLIVPIANACEAALIKEIEVIGVTNLLELIAYLKKEITINPTITDYKQFIKINNDEKLDFNQIKGQAIAKRALQIAASGRHNLLFIGSPGSGKTMLAKRLPSLMPPMTFDEIIQTSKIYSISGKLSNQPLIINRPFRNPHHTISQAGLVGGGTFPQPGEISMAHNGILFLDELTEFKREVLEVLRQPLEHQNVSIARAQQTVTYPAEFLLIAALNPCPCGFYADKRKQCTCTQKQIKHYISKLSGPLLDRIDLQITLTSIDYNEIVSNQEAKYSSAQLLEGINLATKIQAERFGKNNMFNCHISAEKIETYCKLTEGASVLVKKAFEKLYLTMRGYHKLLKVSRTIADLEGKEIIDTPHIKEALFYRSLDANLVKEHLL